MIGLILALLIIGGLGTATVVGVLTTIASLRSTDPYKMPWQLLGAGTLIAAIFTVASLGVATGEINLSSTPPDGCYRISSTTSSGVGVGVGPKGGVTVVPIVLSGHTYEPIACPA